MSSVAAAQRVTSTYQMEEKPGGRNYNRFFAVIILLLLLIIGGELFFHFYVSPRVQISQVNILVEEGLKLSDAQILDIAGLHAGSIYFTVDPAEITRRLESYPLIAEARVEKIFPDSVSMHIYRRKPLAIALVAGETGAVPIAFDAEGVVFQIGKDLEQRDLPIVSGLSFPETRLGMRLPRQITDFLQSLERLKKKNPELFRLISEVKFIKRNSMDFEVMLYPVYHKITIRMGSTLEPALFANILAVVDAAISQGVADEWQEIDARTGRVVYAGDTAQE